MVVRVTDHVRQCYSASDGAVLARVLTDAFANSKHVTLSFAGVTEVTSSFVNASLVSFLPLHGADWLRSHITIKDATAQIADMVRRCLSNGERTLRAA